MVTLEPKHPEAERCGRGETCLALQAMATELEGRVPDCPELAEDLLEIVSSLWRLSSRSVGD